MPRMDATGAQGTSATSSTETPSCTHNACKHLGPAPAHSPVHTAAIHPHSRVGGGSGGHLDLLEQHLLVVHGLILGPHLLRITPVEVDNGPDDDRRALGLSKGNGTDDPRAAPSLQVLRRKRIVIPQTHSGLTIL